MDVHNNACLTPKGREAMVRAVVDGGLAKAIAARRFNTTAKTVAKWVRRFREGGVEALHDRSSRPLTLPSQTPLAACDAVEALRRQRRTQHHIAAELGLSKATVSRILKRRGLSLLSSLEPAEPRPRYERETPGEIVHWTSKNWAVSTLSAIALQEIARAAAVRVGNMFTSPSTTTREWPIRRSTPIRNGRAR